jgi:hypothetical protein
VYICRKKPEAELAAKNFPQIYNELEKQEMDDYLPEDENGEYCEYENEEQNDETGTG